MKTFDFVAACVFLLGKLGVAAWPQVGKSVSRRLSGELFISYEPATTVIDDVSFAKLIDWSLLECGTPPNVSCSALRCRLPSIWI